MKKRLRLYYQKFQSLPPFSQFLIAFALCVFLAFLSDLALNAVVFKKSQKTSFVPGFSPQPSPLISPTPIATISAQGKIAFVRNGDIWAINPDGSREQLLKGDLEAISSEVHRELEWSPDGKFLSWVYEEESSAFHTFYSLEINTGKIYHVMATGACCSIIDYSWSSDGSNIAVLHTDKAGSEPPGFFLSIFSTEGTFSRSNYLEITELLPRRAVWKKENIILGGDGGILVTKPDGSSKKVLLKDTDIFDLDLSSDGRVIVYTKGNDLSLVDIDRRSSKMVYSSEGLIRKPIFSPDGRRIVFTLIEGPIFGDAWMADSDGTLLERLGGQVNPVGWSPDNKRILVVYRVYDTDPVRLEHGTGIGYFDLSQEKDGPGRYPFIPLAGQEDRNVSQPAWSPK